MGIRGDESTPICNPPCKSGLSRQCIESRCSSQKPAKPGISYGIAGRSTAGISARSQANQKPGREHAAGVAGRGRHCPQGKARSASASRFSDHRGTGSQRVWAFSGNEITDAFHAQASRAPTSPPGGQPVVRKATMANRQRLHSGTGGKAPGCVKSAQPK